ncbi:hypothetical protein ACJJTC_011907 [Scirpophaga incertulas]
MWPMLLSLTPDECRRTLRRLELEAYANIISVFRAQGALEDNRKKLLEELRAVLHISNDRHSAEARRVSNDELLATIAAQLSGPNTGIGWICEGRRKIPLLPRGIAQTMYTEIADKAAEAAAAENKEIIKKQEAEKLAAPSNDDEMSGTECLTGDGTMQPSDSTDETTQPQIAMEDQSSNIWETELFNRKRKNLEGVPIADDTPTPVKNLRNIPVNNNQKHLNLSQIYSKYSQPTSSKPSGQLKHSYNQVSKVSTSKSSQSQVPRIINKHRTHKQNSKNSAQAALSKSQIKKHQELPTSPSRQYGPTSMPHEYAGPPNSFQASYAQSVLGGKTKPEYMDDTKSRIVSSPGLISDSPTMQLLTQPIVSHELGVLDNVQSDDSSTSQSQEGMSTTKQVMTNKPRHLIIKRGETPQDKNDYTPDTKLLQKSNESIKVISNRPVVLAPGTTQKSIAGGKLVTTKVIGAMQKTRNLGVPSLTEKMIVVSKPASELKSGSSSKILITSTISTPTKDMALVNTTNIITSSKTTETLTPKGIPATDLKVSAKTVVLNPKSGQKMVVLPAKARTKPGSEGQIPLLHFKSLSTAMKLVPVSSHTASPVHKSTAITVMSKPTVNTISSNPKIVNVEPIKTANLADIVPVKGLAPVATTKITNPIVRPVSAKGGVILVQKGTPIGKALTFTKNGNDMSKIIMGKNINQLLQASKSDPTEVSKGTGNVIVLELNNEQSGRATTMSEILDSRNANVTREPDDLNKVTQITQDTPVLFENQITEETCNANSLDSTTGSIVSMDHIEDSSIPSLDKEEKSNYSKEIGGKDSSGVTDWEMELETVSGKSKDDDDKLNSLHLDLGMSSDSDNDFMGEGHKSKSNSSVRGIHSVTVGEASDIYASSSGMVIPTRTLLSQLQDDGSSSNDSAYSLKTKMLSKSKEMECKIDRSESDALTKAKAKLSEKVAEAKSQQKRIDIFSTAITTSDINLDSFSYLDESMMAGDDVFCGADGKRERRDALDDQLSRLLNDDSATSTDSQTVSDTIPLTK